MADEILSCVKYLNEDETVRLYVFQFSYDGVEYPASWGEITIFPDELTDKEDMVELKALAVSRASAVKALCETAVPMDDMEGPIEL